MLNIIKKKFLIKYLVDDISVSDKRMSDSVVHKRPQSGSSVEKEIFEVNGHKYKPYWFKQMTYCAHCTKLLW